MSDEVCKGTVDVLVIGAGIAGLQSALDLADQGYRIAVVDRGPSIGGHMIGLSKVFPTLDCASCITTPKMAAVDHHPSIDSYTYTEVLGVERDGDEFVARLRQKPRYVKEKDCIGCRQCEYACPVEVRDEFDASIGARRAAYIPFTNAIPQTAVIDPDSCILCGRCVTACPTDAVLLDQEAVEWELRVDAVIAATGWELTPKDAKEQYGRGLIQNVLSPTQMERLLAPHGPYGRVLRPSDGKVPESVAYVQCAGSRDKTLGVPYCSRVCCMYAIKQCMLLSGSLPLADLTIYYMDIRAFGKGYEEFYKSAQAMGIEFVKGKVARLTENEDQSVTVRVERIDQFGQVEERRHDAVVLSLGMVPGEDLSQVLNLPLGTDRFVDVPRPKDAPCRTSLEGVFVAGTAGGPKDIVDTIVEASAAASEASIYLRALRGEHPRSQLDAGVALETDTGGVGGLAEPAGIGAATGADAEPREVSV
jgi:heterodisulfide reductase subunit A2